ncbi:ABC transporter permease [Natronolimnobius sp. AArcel1]|nr:ABC transporter permease [Natronolimnobius sp. AArcel1]
MSRQERAKVIYDRWIASPARVLRQDWRALVGLALLLGYVLMATAGVVLVDAPQVNQGPNLLGPFETLEHPLGTDGNGQDIVSLTVHATPMMLIMITAGAVFATTVATIVGVGSGYIGGNVDQALMTVSDIAMTIPGLPLLIVLAAAVEPSHPVTIGVLLSLTAWAGLARSIRSQVLTLRDVEYVEASRTMGISRRTIMLKDVTPNLMPYILVSMVGHARGVIYASVGLYFLGVLPVTGANWGLTLNRAYSTGGAMHSWDAAHWLIVPMIAIILLSFALLLLSQALDRVFNPRVRAKHMKTNHDAGGSSTSDSDAETDSMSVNKGL